MIVDKEYCFFDFGCCYVDTFWKQNKIFLHCCNRLQEYFYL